MSEPHHPTVLSPALPPVAAPTPSPARLVIDTNAVLGWLVFRDPWHATLDAALNAGTARWLASPATLDELALVLARELPQRWESARKHALTLPWRQAVTACTEPAASRRPGLVCRDASDQKFIDLALAEGAQWLITHDRDLLQLRRRAAASGLAIGTPVQWAAAQASA